MSLVFSISVSINNGPHLNDGYMQFLQLGINSEKRSAKNRHTFSFHNRLRISTWKCTAVIKLKNFMRASVEVVQHKLGVCVCKHDPRSKATFHHFITWCNLWSACWFFFGHFGFWVIHICNPVTVFNEKYLYTIYLDKYLKVKFSWIEKCSFVLRVWTAVVQNRNQDIFLK